MTIVLNFLKLKSLVVDYSFIYFKKFEIIVNNYDFNFKIKMIVDDYRFTPIMVLTLLKSLINYNNLII